MPGLKTNEREGTRAVLRHARISPYKVREVLDLVRGKPVHEAEDILRFSDRDAAFTVGKVLQSAVANAENNDELESEELYVSACFADEGTTIKRWRPRARGRATRIRKRTSHITVIVSRLPEEQLQRLQARRRAEQLAQRARRVAGARRAEGDNRNRADRRAGVALEEPEETEEIEVEAETSDATSAGPVEAGKTADEEATGLVSETSAPSTTESEAELDVEVGAPTDAEVGEAEESEAADKAADEPAAAETTPAVEVGSANETAENAEDNKERDEK
jgi:large subunit ribosomal protein L22